jgi:hypothetical protein
VGSDQTRALIAGGLVGSLFVYLALRAQFQNPSIQPGPPFAFLGYDSLRIGNFYLPWTMGIVAAVYSVFLVLLALSYAWYNPDFEGDRLLNSPRWSLKFRRWGDRLFLAGSIGMVILVFIALARVIEYFALGGSL